MGIIYDEEYKVFHLQTPGSSYCMQIIRDGYLGHLYWGKRIAVYRNSLPFDYIDRGFSPNPDPADRSFSLDNLPQEYPGYGNGDFGFPAYQAGQSNGSEICDLRYSAHRIYAGKPKLPGLPSTYIELDKEADTLELVLEDHLTGLQVTLIYTVFNELDAIARSVQFNNKGTGSLSLQRALSASIDFRDDGYDILTFYGSHTNERNIARRPLMPGIQSAESRRGASSPQQNPFLALLRPGADEDNGEVYALSLVYSGNFIAQAEVQQYRTTRVSIGINPFGFSWKLAPGGEFQTPETVLVYSGQGLGGMSRVFNKLYRTRLCRGKFRDAERPVLINNWEATYFGFDEDKITEIASAGKALGMELFVLDDGWFGKRDNDLSSLGDWTVDNRKLPGGLNSLVQRITGMDMQFGLWFEPEMVSPDSELYRNHPDWCLHVADRPRTVGRNQLVLDLSRQDVCDYIAGAMGDILSSAPITYVKWDMNRHLTEIGSALLPAERQRETGHRYILGLYSILERLTSSFPEVLFESCSSGGGRYDAGMLYYMPQTWASDNTDAVSRLKIQYGNSMVYPAVSMGAHVSGVPNHQVSRSTPLGTRAHVAMSGNLGYELDLTQLSPEEKIHVKSQVALYKEIRPLIQFGDFYRILSPFEGNETAWAFVSADQSEAVLAFFRVLSQPGERVPILKCKGLNPAYVYRHHETCQVYGGDELMYAGLTLPVLTGDYASLFWRFSRVEG
ncbi:alpha-galactosidase [Paenibacillus sp. FSL R7-0273]|uniref:alpha-galactosidase n=1 Tax=Paenibacillus sp. FSL R7-0273 TaxID=1536772 RepID=UPI0004F7E78C|nr:alpha-galactosidase [Paenibacillus sp. FSL R7-0273]AIQ48657.1 alpha-galactosidase [Paenibacillus sp. FSL R7-0273]OMF93999.1 alpha-galactosidase [Paenibacillus sp. FSL R7-0273]